MADRIVHFHVGRSVHPVYAEQLHALPPGFRYRYVHPGLGDATTPPKRVVEQRDTLREARTRAKQAAARTLARAGYVRLSTPRIADDVDLVHSAQFLLRHPRRPYVVDFEQVGVFSLYQQYKAEGESFKPKYLKILSAGGSEAPEKILSDAGIDIRSAKFWQGGFDVLSKMVDELEKL